MKKRRVVLLSEQDLLGESLEHVLGKAKDVDLLGSWTLDDRVLARLSQDTPDILMIAEEDPPGENVARLTAQILEAYPDLPIIRVTLARNELRIYTSQTTPARSADLIDLIRHLPSLTGVARKGTAELDKDGERA